MLFNSLWCCCAKCCPRLSNRVSSYSGDETSFRNKRTDNGSLFRTKRKLTYEIISLSPSTGLTFKKHTLTSPLSSSHSCYNLYCCGSLGLDESSGSGTQLHQTGTSTTGRAGGSGNASNSGVRGNGKGSGGVGGVNGSNGTNAADLLTASPGAYSSPSDPKLPSAAPLERMSTDIPALKKQYSKLQQRMQQVHVIYYGGRNSNDEKPIEVVNPIKTNLAINHLFVLNKDHTKTQLALPSPQTPSSDLSNGTSRNNTTNSSSQPAAQSQQSPPVNHLTIKPYIPTDPLSSSSSRHRLSRPPSAGSTNTNRSPKGNHTKSLSSPHRKSSASVSPISNNSSADVLSSSSTPNYESFSKMQQLDDEILRLYGKENEENVLSNKKQQVQPRSNSNQSYISSPRSIRSNSTLPDYDADTATPLSPLSSSHRTDESCSNDEDSASTRTPKEEKTSDLEEDKSANNRFDFDEKVHFVKPNKSSSSSGGTGSNAAKNLYRKTPLKPNIRPNLGMNDRPRIYNPFPVNYVHNTKLRRGKNLGLYPVEEKPLTRLNQNSQNGEIGLTATTSVLGKLGLK